MKRSAMVHVASLIGALSLPACSHNNESRDTLFNGQGEMTTGGASSTPSAADPPTEMGTLPDSGDDTSRDPSSWNASDSGGSGSGTGAQPGRLSAIGVDPAQAGAGDFGAGGSGGMGGSGVGGSGGYAGGSGGMAGSAGMGASSGMGGSSGSSIRSTGVDRAPR